MEDIINFFHKIGELKKIKRKGWVLKKVPNPESVAEHIFRTATITLILADKAKVNKDKCVKMALFHDLPEALVGDLTPHDNISVEKRHEKEKQALKEMLKDIDDKGIYDIWIEYLEGKTPESKFVKEIEQIEMLLQAYEYEQEHKGKDINLDEFWPYVKKRIKSPYAKKIYDLLVKKRTK